MSNALTSFRSNKRLLYAATGLVGGALGAVFAEIALRPDASGASTPIRDVVETALWSAAFASILGTALFLAGEWHQRRELKPERVAKVLALSAAAGFLSGAGAQYLYSMDIGSWELRNFGLRIAAWAVMGALLGAMLSRSVPNLGLARGFGAGAVGGAVGCMGFLLTLQFLPGVVGRIVGVALLGLALGLAMYFVENMFREASVEVEWAPYETSRVGLGPTPVFIGGGGEEHIFKKGLPPAVSSLVLRDGLIEHVETANGKRTPLQDGSRLRIGGLNLMVHAVPGSAGSAANRTKHWGIAGSVVAAVTTAAVAMTLTGLGETPPTNTAGAPGKITTLTNVGDSATLDTAVPLTGVSVRLDWRAAVDLDLGASYTLKSGQSGWIRYDERTGPNIRLDTDAGVGDKGGQNEENIAIDSLDEFEVIWFITDIGNSSEPGTYSDYDGRVTLQTKAGDEVRQTIEVPLISTEIKPYLVIAKLIDGPDGPTMVNVNIAAYCNDLVELIGFGTCSERQPKSGASG